MLIDELEYESQCWINTPEDVEAKIGDHLWEHPGASSHDGKLSMPGEELWRFAADSGLPNAEEEVRVSFKPGFLGGGEVVWERWGGRFEHESGCHFFYFTSSFFLERENTVGLLCVL